MTNNDFSADDFDKLLDDFIASQLQDAEDALFESQEKNPKTATTEEASSEEKQASSENHDVVEEVVNIAPTTEKNYSYFDFMHDYSKEASSLAQEEFRLYEAVTNLMKSSIDCIKEINENEAIDYFDFDIKYLLPRFSPRRIDNLSQNINNAWVLLLKAQPEELSKLDDNASDEQILNFAEQSSNQNLMMALISYVETLIEVDACEIAYNIRKAKYKKIKIEKSIYEAEKARKDKIRSYIQAIKDKNFPIDAEMLVNNFFKTVRIDPDGAKKMLEHNPATFAPIQVDKIPNRLFGLIKAKPEDGKKVNKKLGQFLKNLKA